MRYRVHIHVDVDATTPLEAAYQASQQEPNASNATITIHAIGEPGDTPIAEYKLRPGEWDLNIHPNQHISHV